MSIKLKLNIHYGTDSDLGDKDMVRTNLDCTGCCLWALFVEHYEENGETHYELVVVVVVSDDNVGSWLALALIQPGPRRFTEARNFDCN